MTLNHVLNVSCYFILQSGSTGKAAFSCAHRLGPVRTANPYVDGSNPSVHLYLIRLTGEDRGFRILKYGFKSRMRYPGMW